MIGVNAICLLHLEWDIAQGAKKLNQHQNFIRINATEEVVYLIIANHVLLSAL